MAYKDLEKKKECKKRWWKKYYANPDNRIKKLEQSRKNHIESYGITVEKFNSFINSQENRCGCCKKEFNDTERSKKPCMDHNHETGKIRGVLCWSCNIAAGLLEENTDTMRNMIKWIKNFRGTLGALKPPFIDK